jgi:uncharacterized damage-inducible protein DinB
MSNSILRRMGVYAVAMMAVSKGAFAQPPKPEPVMRDFLVQQWNEVGEKIIKMAEEFPEDKYEFRPVAGVRTFGDVLRHVAFWNTYVTKTARGEQVDGRINELPKAQYATKAAIVKALKTTLQESAGALKAAPATPPTKLQGLFVTFIEHSGEHYGQLVVYYRLNNLVPPASRTGD